MKLKDSPISLLYMITAKSLPDIENYSVHNLVYGKLLLCQLHITRGKKISTDLSLTQCYHKTEISTLIFSV